MGHRKAQSIMSQKRDSSSLTPPISETAKRYMFNPETLISANRYYLPENASAQVSEEVQENISINPQQTTDMNIDQDEHSTNIKLKIPPIYLHEAGNYNEVLNDIKAITLSDFTTVTKGKLLRVNTTTVEDYRNLTKFYNQSSVKFHTFKNPEENNLSVMIRNIPISLTEIEIKSELLKLKYPILKVARLYNKQKVPIPICAVDLEKTTKAKEIFQLEKLNYCIVTVEPRRINKDIAQCKRCQRFGHTKNYCQLEPRCVKCTGTHLYTNCPKKPEQPPQCVNCGENHPANYRGCPLYSKITKSRMQQTRTTPTINTADNKPLRHYQPATSDKPYSEALKNNQNSPTDANGESSDILETIIKQIINLIIPHIKPLLLKLLPSLLENGP